VDRRTVVPGRSVQTRSRRRRRLGHIWAGGLGPIEGRGELGPTFRRFSCSPVKAVAPTLSILASPSSPASREEHTNHADGASGWLSLFLIYIHIDVRISKRSFIEGLTERAASLFDLYQVELPEPNFFYLENWFALGKLAVIPIPQSLKSHISPGQDTERGNDPF
jgi:hypothetical protein